MLSPLEIDMPSKPEAELWRAMGRALEARRKALHLSAAAVARSGGPGKKTVINIEQGRVSRVTQIERLAKALRLEVADVVRSALQPEALSPEAARLVDDYQRLESQRCRDALLAVASCLAENRPNHKRR